MAEFGRAVQTALRSTLPLRNAAILRWQPCHNLNLTTAPVGSYRRFISSSPNLRADGDRNGRPAYSSGWSDSRPPRPNRAKQEEFTKPRMESYSQSQKDDFDVLNNDTNFAAGIDLDLSDLESSMGKEQQEAPIPSGPPMRLVPRTGRTVTTGRNVDVARSFKMLAVQVAQNRLRQDFQLQRFHERPGLKRKRLKMERWRKRFKKGFKAAVARVQELTRQGW